MKAKIIIGSGLLLLALPLLGGPPAWLFKGEVLIVATFALIYGFTAFSPRLPAWAMSREVVGIALVALGCVCLLVPPSFVCCALLTGCGARMIVLSDFKVASSMPQKPGDIVIRPSTPMEKAR